MLYFTWPFCTFSFAWVFNVNWYEDYFNSSFREAFWKNNSMGLIDGYAYNDDGLLMRERLHKFWKREQVKFEGFIDKWKQNKTIDDRIIELEMDQYEFVAWLLIKLFRSHKYEPSVLKSSRCSLYSGILDVVLKKGDVMIKFEGNKAYVVYDTRFFLEEGTEDDKLNAIFNKVKWDAHKIDENLYLRGGRTIYMRLTYIVDETNYFRLISRDYNGFDDIEAFVDTVFFDLWRLQETHDLLLIQNKTDFLV